MTVTRYTAGMKVFDPNVDYEPDLTTEVFAVNSTYRGPFSSEKDRKGATLHDYVHTLQNVKLEFHVQTFQVGVITLTLY
jgi:hypothetical protein